MRTLSPKRRAVVLLCCVLACVLGARRARAQEEMQVAPVPMQSAAKDEEPKSVVFGRVVFDDTGRPVRRARVMLLGIDIKGPTHAAQTNARGEFRVKNVPAGRYFLAVDASGILSPVSFLDLQAAKNGNPNFDEISKHFQEIEVDGKGRKEVTVRAVRGAAVGGKVTYADGDPATGVTVHVLRMKDGRATPILIGIARADFIIRTDDRGVYRVTGLPPGEYVIGVSEPVEHGESETSGMETGPGGSLLMMTFHPSAARPDKAASFKLEAGEDREGVDITIQARGAHAVSGVVRGRRDSRPVANASVTLSSKETGMNDLAYVHLAGGARQYVRTDENGRWQFDEIPDGAYSVSVEPPVERTQSVEDAPAASSSEERARAYAMPRKKYAQKEQSFKVAGADLDLVVELNEGASISGTVTYEDGGKPEDYVNRHFYVTAGGPEGEPTGSNSDYVTSGKFELSGVPAGKVFLRFTHIDGAGDLQKTYLKSLTWKGRDLLREPLEVAEGAEIEGVSAVYSKAVASLRVRAVGGDGKTPAFGARVHLVPWDAATRARPGTRLSCEADGAGSCTLSGAPGEYAVVALPRFGLADGEADFNERAAKARRVTLRAGDNDPFEIVIQESR